MTDNTAQRIIAMWSGPRNLSTAMMRSFGNRADCSVMDEPFYAAYLARSGMDHPMRDEIIAAGETDPEAVAAQCLYPAGAPISYQKHMMHHMLDGFPLDWVGEVTNVFLIRDPVRVLASYAAKWADVRVRDTGFKQQRALFDRLLSETGRPPLVVDAQDIRAAPEAVLTALCRAIEIPFDPAMLRWAPGARVEDGIWGAHWYDAIWRSTGFAPPEMSPLPPLPRELMPILDAVQVDYDYMRAFCLSA